MKWQLYSENVNEFNSALCSKYCSIEYEKHMSSCHAVGVYCCNVICIMTNKCTDSFLSAYSIQAHYHKIFQWKYTFLIDAIDVTEEKKIGMHCNEKTFTCLRVNKMEISSKTNFLQFQDIYNNCLSLWQLLFKINRHCKGTNSDPSSIW